MDQAKYVILLVCGTHHVGATNAKLTTFARRSTVLQVLRTVNDSEGNPSPATYCRAFGTVQGVRRIPYRWVRIRISIQIFYDRVGKHSSTFYVWDVTVNKIEESSMVIFFHFFYHGTAFKVKIISSSFLLYASLCHHCCRSHYQDIIVLCSAKQAKKHLRTSATSNKLGQFQSSNAPTKEQS